MKLPQELQGYINDPATAPRIPSVQECSIKQIFLLTVEHLPDRCENCGGQRYIYAFFSYSGPHEHKNHATGVTSKWMQGGWYYGGMRAFPCPVCSPDSDEYVLQHGPPVEQES